MAMGFYCLEAGTFNHSTEYNKGINPSSNSKSDQIPDSYSYSQPIAAHCSVIECLTDSDLCESFSSHLIL